MRPTAVHHHHQRCRLRNMHETMANQYNTERVSISMEFRFETIEERLLARTIFCSSRCNLSTYGISVDHNNNAWFRFRFHFLIAITGIQFFCVRVHSVFLSEYVDTITH